MNHIEQVIREAVENGYGGTMEGHPLRVERCDAYDAFQAQVWFRRDGVQSMVYLKGIFLDPLFWQALGKARGWQAPESRNRDVLNGEWVDQWHRFIDHLAEGNDAESFFSRLGLE
jgi:hypothetical protein